MKRPYTSAWNPVGVSIILLLVSLSDAHSLAATRYKGQVKSQSVFTQIPGDSSRQDFTDNISHEHALDFRLNLSVQQPDWVIHVDYQLSTRNSDRAVFGDSLVSDKTRLLNLNQVISEDGDSITTQRLDRLNLYYADSHAVVKIGRQAVSWGNGLVYNPMDFFNPFDPTAIDSEYKTGDDMLYTQYLLESGNDLQAVWVGRRDARGNISQTVTSTALKYHWIKNELELDFLLARHFNRQILGLGAVGNIGGAIWRSDLILNTNENNAFSDSSASAVLNLSYSWLGWGKNMSGGLEYYRNGFGIADADYSSINLDRHAELLARLQRGELFTLGRDYISASVMTELTPLWLLTSAVFTNLNDTSSLLQLLSQHDLTQNLKLSIAAGLPVGTRGSEYGGIDSGLADGSLSPGRSLTLHLSWYF